MAFFDSLKTSLKQKWLPFFQANRAWITRQMAMESVETPDGGRRPSSYLILGVVSALEPALADLLLPFSQLSSEPDNLIDVLDLNFDPEMYLNSHSGYLAITPEPMEGLLDTSDEVIMVLPDGESVMLQDTSEADELSVMSLDELADETEAPEPKLAHHNINTPEATNNWFSESARENPSEDGQTLEGNVKSGDKQASTDDEISRLFPNF